jgi:ferredoxin-NADP reductase
MTTRISPSAFKQALRIAEPGIMCAQLRGPAGRFGLRDDDTGTPVLLAGGVGITPVMSILRDAENTGRSLNASLIYGSVSDECIPYREEIIVFDSALVRTSFVIEQPGPGWNGLAGFITADTVRACVDDPAAHCYYVTGPPAMVSAMSAVLDELHIAEESRRVERFGR